VSPLERELPFREGIVSEETISLRRRCSCGSAILGVLAARLSFLVGMSLVLEGFHVTTKVRE
jgi:hypothetical protein